MIDVTRQAVNNPKGLISDLGYSCYSYNRDEGMSAESLLRLFPETGEAMEKRYEEESK